MQTVACLANKHASWVQFEWKEAGLSVLVPSSCLISVIGFRFRSARTVQLRLLIISWLWSYQGFAIDNKTPFFVFVTSEVCWSHWLQLLAGARAEQKSFYRRWWGNAYSMCSGTWGDCCMSAIHIENQQDPYIPDYPSLSDRFGSSILPRELGHQALNVSAEQSGT